MIQGYFDESYNKDGPYVLAGFFAAKEVWSSFTKDWQLYLKSGTVCAKTQRYHFHMTEMMANDERQSRILPFYKLIFEHNLVPFSVSLNQKELRKAQQSIQVRGFEIDWHITSDPYYICFRTLIDNFIKFRRDFDKLLPADDPTISFIFDENSIKSTIRSSWREFSVRIPDSLKKYYNEPPRFASDKDELPLQAADMLAWLVRYSNLRKVDTQAANGSTFREPKFATHLPIQVYEQRLSFPQIQAAILQVARISIERNHQIITTNLDMDEKALSNLAKIHTV